MTHSIFDRTFAALATVAVAAAAVAGFWILGTPGQQRLIMSDRQRLEDLSAIANTLYWKKQDQDDYVLPETLDPEDQREDPITQELYRYTKLDDSQYQLCANFATDSSTHKIANTNPKNWQHPQGSYCFELDVNQAAPSLY
ncbi:hypothetical protein [Leptothoe spongobia]|uniref:Uncharacterized protein n=1 Tax=Leptothoe spongobia TAU-MAC 1115 TaxID=1967444 RepID=A0A947GIV3_9CYAN|nr:hypothetical protein [Leptothoe spongobia]MBT9315984.1 hypothetical protein [Leptothoe spongobia TAU-MAC 1115]